jgi:hypothetical protein
VVWGGREEERKRGREKERKFGHSNHFLFTKFQEKFQMEIDKPKESSTKQNTHKYNLKR